MDNLLGRLMLGGSVATLTAVMTSFGAGTAALAQANASSEPVEEVVVTGTSIRGVAPIGSNLISVTPLCLDYTDRKTKAKLAKVLDGKKR